MKKEKRKENEKKRISKHTDICTYGFQRIRISRILEARGTLEREGMKYTLDFPLSLNIRIRGSRYSHVLYYRYATMHVHQLYCILMITN